MKLKPLKISWRAWCLEQLARRDYSAHEMREKIRRRAQAAGQQVDADAEVAQLVAEGIVDDRRYLENQVAMHTGTVSLKGPRELERRFSVVGGVADSLIAEYIQPDDPRWFDLARDYSRRCFEREAGGAGSSQQVPEKLFFRVRSQLQRKGFTRAQVEAALSDYRPVREDGDGVSAETVRRWVEKRMADGRGPGDIRQFLRHKGIPDGAIQPHLGLPDEIWIDAAARERERRFGAGKPRSAKEKRQQTDFLRRRGFSFDHIAKALELA